MIVFACTELMHSFLGVKKVYYLWISVIDLFEIYAIVKCIFPRKEHEISHCLTSLFAVFLLNRW